MQTISKRALIGKRNVPTDATITSTNIFSAYIANASTSKGEWVDFPTTADTISEVMDCLEIGEHTGYVISGYEYYITELRGTLGEYEDLNELNYLATRISHQNEHFLNKFKAALILVKPSTLAEMVDIINGLWDFDFRADIHSLYDLGYTRANDKYADLLNKMSDLGLYIDFQGYGEMCAERENGHFTNYGYISQIDRMERIYTGVDDIPSEYMVL